MREKYELLGNSYNKSQSLRRIEEPPSLEELGLDYKQQQMLARHVAFNYDTKLDTIVELADTLATQEIYQASFEWVLNQFGKTHKEIEQSHPISFLSLSEVAINEIADSYKTAGIDDVENAVIISRLACWVILSHKQFNNLHLSNFKKLVEDAQQMLNGPGYEHTDLPQSYSSMISIKAVLHFLERIRLNQGKESRLAEQLSNRNDELFKRTRELQKYGIKSVYVAEAEAMPIADWHVFDQQSFKADETIFAGLDTYRCSFFGFSSSLVNEPPDFESGYISYKLEGSNENAFGFDLHNDGHLYTKEKIPLSWLTDELGIVPQYELLRARALSIYADLVIPAYIVDQAEQIRVAEKQIVQAKRVRIKDFLELVLARQKILASPDMPQLIDQNEKDEKRRRRVVSPHGVVGFIRRLPAGQRASQAQRQLCLEDQGIELPLTGETYVRAHIRGGNRQGAAEIKFHRARIRHAGGTIISQDESDSQNLLDNKTSELKPRLTLPGL